MRYGEAGQSHLLPFLGAAALFAALTITAHSLVLGLAAVIAGPVPAAQTALSLSRKSIRRFPDECRFFCPGTTGIFRIPIRECQRMAIHRSLSRC